RHHRRPRVPRPRHRRAGRDLRRDRSPRAGGAPRRARAAAPGALPLAAGRGAAVRAAGLRAAAPRALAATGARDMSPGAIAQAFQALHFLRPQWLWALLALPLLAWAWRRHRARRGAWREAVDAHLLPHLLERGEGRRGIAALGALLLGFAVAVLALAGPSWRQGEQPLLQGEAPLVVVLEMSGAMLAADLPPSRLLQARAKLATLLERRSGGQVGLVVYADDAYTVAPLTRDAANVALFLD